jgi:hypothetical protein
MAKNRDAPKSPRTPKNLRIPGKRQVSGSPLTPLYDSDSSSDFPLVPADIDEADSPHTPENHRTQHDNAGFESQESYVSQDSLSPTFQGTPQPSPAASSSIHLTPSEHGNKGPLRREQHDRVLAASGNKKLVCLATGRNESIQLSHILDRGTGYDGVCDFSSLPTTYSNVR